MANKGKIKGNSFERDISKRLSLWISNNERDDLIWRTHNSGGRFTSRMKKGIDTKNQGGDLTSTTQESEYFINNFYLELKFYKDIAIWNLITGIKSGILCFWDQTLNGAELTNKIPVLIVKQNRKPALWCTDNKGKNIFEKFTNLSFKMKVNIDLDKQLFVYNLDDVMNLDSEFLKLVG